MAEFEDSIAHTAHGLVHGERAKTYGHPRFDFTAIAKVWTGLLQDLLKDDAHLDAYRISILMTGLKLCRLVKSPQHKDSRIDTIGYMLTMERLDEPTEEELARADAAAVSASPVMMSNSARCSWVSQWQRSSHRVSGQFFFAEPLPGWMAISRAFGRAVASEKWKDGA